MIVGSGIDLVDNARFQASLDRYGDRYLGRIFTADEMSLRSAFRPLSFAQGLACKEAAMKALGTGWTDRVDWRDIEIFGNPAKRLTVIFHRGAVRRARHLRVISSWASTTWSRPYSFAHVILEGGAT